MAQTLADLIAVEEVAPNEYVSKTLPPNMGVALPVAYGGFTLGVAVHAACLTVPSGFHLYSVLGHYHGPGSLDEKMKCTIVRTRDTRSFATRRVQVTQTHRSGKTRLCMELIADFHIREQGGLTYSATPTGQYPPPQDLPTHREQSEAFVARGQLSKKQLAIHEARTEPLGAIFDIRQCPNSVAGQNLYGLLKPIATTQDHLPTGSKVSAEWIRLREPLTSQPEQMAALAFGLDGGLSSLPLVHSDTRIEEVVAASSLDFALRVMQPVVDVTKWHVSERLTSSGAGAITYAEVKLFDSLGVMVASMSQQSIFRLQGNPKSSL